MKKIISLFKRDYEGTHLVYDEVTPGAEWVINGEGRATVKIDGTACLIKDGKLYKRYDAKKGKTPPADFIPAQEAPDEVTGHFPGWVPVGDGPEDKWHKEAFSGYIRDREPGAPEVYPDGTYELIGPKINGNPHQKMRHEFILHGSIVIDPPPPRTFNELGAWLDGHEVEGIVWHHPDGRMVKIKRRDFGLPWPVKKEK